MAVDIANLIMNMVEDDQIDIHLRLHYYKVKISIDGRPYSCKIFETYHEANYFTIFHAGITAMKTIGRERFKINPEDSN